MADEFNLRLPLLGKNNYKLWRASVMAYADEHNLRAILSEVQQPPTTVAQQKQHAQAFRLVTSTLSPDTML